MKRFLSLLTALILLTGMLPADAAAQNFTMITEKELAALESVSGYNSSAYHAGMSFSAGMTAYQMFCWLEDYLEEDVENLSAMCAHFRLDEEEHLKTSGMRAEMNALLARADEVIAKLNYYDFELSNLIERAENEKSNLNNPDLTSSDIRMASYYLQQILTDLPALMKEFAAARPKAVAEVNALLRELDGMHEDTGTVEPNLRVSGAGMTLTGAGGATALQGAKSLKDLQTAKDADFRFTVLGAEDIVIRLYDDETLLPITDAKVTVLDEVVDNEKAVSKAKNKATVSSDPEGRAIFDTGCFRLNENKQMNATVLITANGYREVMTTVYGFTAGETWEMGLKKDDGTSYIKYLMFRGVDLLHDTETVYYTPYNDAKQSFRVGVMVKKGSAGYFRINYLDATTGEDTFSKENFTGGKTGLQELNFDDQWCCRLVPDSPVTLTFETVTNGVKETKVYDSLIDVRKAVVDKPLHNFKANNFFSGGGVNINFPKSWPLLGRMTIGLKYPFEKLDNFPVDLTLNLDGSFVLSVGLFGAKQKVNNFKGDTEEEKIADGQWKRINGAEQRESIRAFKENKSVMMEEFRNGLAKKADKHKLMDFFNVTLNGNVAFMLSGQIQANKDKYVTGVPYTGIMDASIVATVNATASLNEPFAIPPFGIPAFWGVDLTVGFTLGTSVMFSVDIMGSSPWDLSKWTNPQFLGGTWDLAFSPYVMVSFYLGVGVKKFISAYVKCTFSLVTEVHVRPLAEINKLRLKATLSVRIDLVISYLIGTLNINLLNQPLWSKDSDDKNPKDPGHQPIDDKKKDEDKKQDPEEETPREDTEPIHYTAIGSRKVTSVDHVSASAKFVKYDNAVYYFDKDWLNDILKRQLSEKKDYVPMQLRYFRSDSDTSKLTSVSWEGGIGHGAFPGGIPDDAYIAYFDVTSSDQVNAALWKAGTGKYLNLGLLILFARSGEDETVITDGVQQRRATRYYCELDVLSNTVSTSYSVDYGYTSAPYRHIQTVSIGAGYEITDPSQIHLRCDEEILRESGGNRGENVYYAYSLLDGNELFCGVVNYLHYYRATPLLQYGLIQENESRHARILLDDTKSARDAYVFRADTLVGVRRGLGLDTVVLYNDPTSDQQTLTYTRYALGKNDRNMTPSNVMSSCSQETEHHFDSLLLVENEVTRPEFILGLADPDEMGKYALYMNEVLFYGWDDAYKASGARFTDTGARVSPGQFQALKIGSNYVLFYPEKATSNDDKLPCYTVNGVYVSRDNHDRLLFTHQMHLGEFPYTGSAGEVNPDDILVGFEMFRDDKGFMDGAFVEMGGSGSALTHFRVKQTMQLDIRAISAQSLTIVPGDTLDLLFSVMNTGNVPLSKFTLRAYGEDASGNQIDISSLNISLKDPDTSAVVQKVGSEVVNHVGNAAVSPFDDAADTKGLWFVNSGASYQTYETDLLMPEDSHNYRASFTIPTDFKHARYTIHLAVDSLSAEAYQRKDSELYDAAFLNPSGSPISLSSSDLLASASSDDEPVPVTVTALLQESPASDIGGEDLSGELVPVTLTAEGGAASGSGALLSASSAPALPLASSTLPDRALIPTDAVDLTINARYAFAGDEKMVHIVIRNESSEPVDQLVLTAYVDEKKSWQSTFDPSLSLNELDTISMDLPMSKLTAGKDGRYLNLSIQGRTSDAFPVDNADSMLIANPFTIILHPEDQTVQAGQTATFRVKATGGTLPYTYQWQVSTGRDGPWTDIAGAVGDTLTLTNRQMKDSGLFYRAVVTDAEGRVLYSNPALLLVTKVPLTGDRGFPAGWIALAMLSAAGALLTFRAKKRRREG